MLSVALCFSLLLEFGNICLYLIKDIHQLKYKWAIKDYCNQKDRASACRIWLDGNKTNKLRISD